MCFTFGDIVIVEDNLIGVVVKSWCGSINGKILPHHEVYVRSFNGIRNYTEDKMRRYMVIPKELSEDELYYQDKIDGKGGGEDSDLHKIKEYIKDWFKKQ